MLSDSKLIFFTLESILGSSNEGKERELSSILGRAMIQNIYLVFVDRAVCVAKNRYQNPLAERLA